MNGQNIPGFYWDSEKKKYFRIQTAAAARDQQLKYSRENIRKKEREERIQGAATAKSTRARKERVIRQHGSLTQTCQEREIGSRRRSFYVQSSWPNSCVYGMSTQPKKVVDKPSGALIRRFDRDPISKTLYVVHGDNSIKRRRIRREEDGPPLPDGELETDDYVDSIPLNPYSFEPWDELQRTTSTISSLSYLPITGALAATTYGSDRPPVVYLSDPDRDGPYVGQQFTPKGCSTIWGAAARPNSFLPLLGAPNSVASSHVEHIAVAASSSMLLFTRSQSGTWDSTTPVTSLDADVLALDWISNSTIALGCRDGKIRLYDTRSGGSSHILTHPQPVSKIKRADDPTRLVVSGLQDSLHLYDIRSSRISRDSHTSLKYENHHYNEEYFENLYPGGRNHRKRRKMKHAAFKNWSQPVLTFPHANVDDLELDIDVHLRLGLIAAGQSLESSTAIRVTNMWSGKTVKEFEKHDGRDGSQVNDRMRFVKFMEDEEDGGVSLWTNWAGTIARFGW